MRNQLTKAIQIVDSGVTKLKAYSFTGQVAPSTHHESRKNTMADKFPLINVSANNSHLNEEDM